ncbi:polysaccharide pyruvyl transferase family protein [Pseudoalteromonas sp. DL2-H2.2]|uniref:polysaccharide pyruvyl transferase family protein n=1 Tax=Pseudoalteromonas sp. DL2-H2.2 TaxID=2908889 RepID=UPI001F44E961|nr:polysaccharide pyruvyl transferase family protein [Pseudoalteromonas sp. DL2-H2.2]MCF2908448.1 polysaccharide pyruvyl transferase family protein [Pseudoalteromonas sp. DL2-H2.2]
MAAKNKAYIVGYYGMRNSGDDALMLASVMGARHFLNSEQVTVSAPAGDPLVNQLNCSGQQALLFRGHQRLWHYRHAYGAQHVIFGGGSVLHSSRDIALKRHMMALSGRNLAMALGVGIEPFKTLDDELQCKKFLYECGLVTLRDKQSYDIAEALAPHANLKHTFDLAPSLLHHLKGKLNPVARQGIAFNFCPQSIDAFGAVNEHNELRRIAKAVDLITTVWSFTNEDIYLIDLNDQAQGSDRAIHDEIEARLPDYVTVKRIRYVPNPASILQCMAMFRVVVGMRLHAQIYAYMTQTPFISLQYHAKCTQWCEQIGLPEQYAFDANEFNPDTLFRVMYRGLDRGFDAPRLAIGQATTLSLSNWSEHYEHHPIHSRYSAV